MKAENSLMEFKSKILFSFILVVFILGHLGSLFFQKEYWPFSPYPMYSEALHSEEWSYFSISAYNAQGEDIDFSIRKAFFPYWERALFESMLAQSKSVSSKAIQDTQNLFLKQLSLWRSDAVRRLVPQAVGLRLYELNYTFLNLRNLAKDGRLYIEKAQPTTKKLVTEVTFD